MSSIRGGGFDPQSLKKYSACPEILYNETIFLNCKFLSQFHLYIKKFKFGKGG